MIFCSSSLKSAVGRPEVHWVYSRSRFAMLLSPAPWGRRKGCGYRETHMHMHSHMQEYHTCTLSQLQCSPTHLSEFRLGLPRLAVGCYGMSTGPTIHHQFKERVGSKSIGSMHGCTCRLPSCIQSWDDVITTLWVVLDHLPGREGGEFKGQCDSSSCLLPN